jgi:hypothetical protein
MIQILRHRDQMVLDITQVQPNVAGGRDPPVLVAPFREPFDDVGFVAHEAEEAHDLFAAGTYAPEHVGLLGFFEDEHKLVDGVDFVFDTLDEGTEGVGDIVDEGVGDPVGGYGDVVFELFDPATDVLRMGSWAEVKLRR